MTAQAWVAAGAGLLHDIGKFRQRARWSERRTHQVHGHEWVCEHVLPRLAFLDAQARDQVAQAVLRHHEAGAYERDLRVVRLADRLASGERVQRSEEGTGDRPASCSSPCSAPWPSTGGASGRLTATGGRTPLPSCSWATLFSPWLNWGGKGVRSPMDGLPSKVGGSKADPWKGMLD